MPISKQRGFTLIELLVVIGIIAMLSSFVLTSLSGAREKSRNSVRLQEVTAYSKAVELYQSSGGVYPNGAINWTAAPSYRCLGRSAATTCFAGSYTGNATLNTQLQSHISAVVSGSDTGLALGGYAYRCIVAVNGAPCYQYTILYQLEGTGQSCAGGFRLNASYNGTNTYCQIIQCGAGKIPTQTGGPTTPYTCV